VSISSRDHRTIQWFCANKYPKTRFELSVLLALMGTNTWVASYFLAEQSKSNILHSSKKILFQCTSINQIKHEYTFVLFKYLIPSTIDTMALGEIIEESTGKITGEKGFGCKDTQNGSIFCDGGKL
jgi:hypothetical protein